MALRYGKYAGLPSDTDLSDAALDAKCSFVVLYCNFTSLAFLGLLGF